MFFIKSWFSSWTALGTLLGPSRHPLGTLLGLSWGALGRSWTLLGHFPAAPGRLKSAQEAAGVRTGRAKKRKKTDFSLSCCFLAALGPVLAPLGLILAPPGQYFSAFLGLPGGAFGYVVHGVFWRSAFQSFLECLLGIWLGSA